MLDIKIRYRDDPQLRMLVDYMVVMIDRLQFTPSELREAAMLAAIIYENTHVRSVFVASGDALQPRA